MRVAVGEDQLDELPLDGVAVGHAERRVVVGERLDLDPVAPGVVERPGLAGRVGDRQRSALSAGVGFRGTSRAVAKPPRRPRRPPRPACGAAGRPSGRPGAPMLMAATTRPDVSRIGAAIEATPISRSSTASDQPRARIRASSVRSAAGSVTDFGVICASGDAAASTRSQLRLGEVREQRLAGRRRVHGHPAAGLVEEPERSASSRAGRCRRPRGRRGRRPGNPRGSPHAARRAPVRRRRAGPCATARPGRARTS